MTNHGYIYRARVGAADAGKSVLAFHVARFRHSDETAWRESIDLGRVLVNGRPAAADELLRADDELEFHRPPWPEPDAPESFDVAFEDEHVLVVVKPAGLQVLPAGPFSARTLLKLVRSSDPSRAAAAPAHRLGRGTSGLIAFGKTTLGRASLVRQFRERSLTKTYLAWVEGKRLPDSLAVRAPIGRIEHGALVIHAAAEHGRAALTRVRVLRRQMEAALVGATVGAALAATAESRLKPLPQEPLPQERALVAAQPITGRPDQIRIHLAAAGAPIVGDPLFGPGGLPKSDTPPGTGGYLLHATALAFAHPLTGARVKLRSWPHWMDAATIR